MTCNEWTPGYAIKWVDNLRCSWTMVNKSLTRRGPRMGKAFHIYLWAGCTDHGSLNHIFMRKQTRWRFNVSELVGTRPPDIFRKVRVLEPVSTCLGYHPYAFQFTIRPFILLSWIRVHQTYTHQNNLGPATKSRVGRGKRTLSSIPHPLRTRHGC